MSEKDIQERMITLSPKVRNNADIVSSKEIEGGKLLHISTDSKLNKLIPFISKRQSDMEDRTVARICTAPTLLGCIIGANNTIYEFLYGFDKEKISDSDYIGGFTIYDVPFEHALKPNASLVYDCKQSDEHWLITYNVETAQYKPTKVGKMFISSITYHGRDKDIPEADYIFYLEVKADSLNFNSKRNLKKGFYKVCGPIDAHTKNFKEDKPFTIEEVKQTEYEDARLRTASLLSYQEQNIFNNW